VYQIPNELLGPPTLVLLKFTVELLNPPDPKPGFTRIPILVEIPAKL
jgi:hypothetical protein